MEKKVVCQIENGVDSLMRVVGLLKRKQFDIKDVNMTNNDNTGYSLLEITLIENLRLSALNALHQLEKIEDANNIRIIN